MLRKASFKEKVDYFIRDVNVALHNAYLWHGKKVRVCHEKTIGRTYWANNNQRSDNLVFKHSFGGEVFKGPYRGGMYGPELEDTTGKFMCSNFAPMDALIRYRKAKGESMHLAREVFYKDWTKTLDSRSAIDFTRTIAANSWLAAPEYHHVQHEAFGAWVQHEMAKIIIPDGEKKAFKVFAIHTNNHMMTLTLTKKAVNEDQNEYRITLYDPNVTYNHVKIRVDSYQKLADIKLRSLLIENGLAEYSPPAPPNAPSCRAPDGMWKYVELPEEMILNTSEYLKKPEITETKIHEWKALGNGRYAHVARTETQDDYLGVVWDQEIVV